MSLVELIEDRGVSIKCAGLGNKGIFDTGVMVPFEVMGKLFRLHGVNDVTPDLLVDLGMGIPSLIRQGVMPSQFDKYALKALSVAFETEEGRKMYSDTSF